MRRKLAQILRLAASRPILSTLPAALCATLAACTKMPASPPEEVEANKHIWVTHCEGPAFHDVTKSPTYGDYETGLVAKVSDKLILALPKNAAPTYLGPDPASTRCTRPQDLPENAYVGFFVVLSPTGYDAATPIQQSREEDRVRVRVWTEKHATFVHPAAFLNQLLDEQSSQGPLKEKEVLGLNCYGNYCNYCFGNSSPGDTPDIYVSLRPGGWSADMLSTDYPGVGIHWQTSDKNLPRWKDIAGLVATRLREWNALRQIDTVPVAPSNGPRNP